MKTVNLTWIMVKTCSPFAVIEIQSHSYDAYNNVSLTVYKVTVLDVDLLLDSTAIYDMKVQQVLKESMVQYSCVSIKVKVMHVFRACNS